MSDRVIVMHGGRIEQIGAPGEIYDRPSTEWVARFIGDTNFIRTNGREVAVRPERIRLVAAGDGLEGRVSTTMVIGPAVQCVVRLDDGQEVLVRQQRSTDDDWFESLREGDRAVVTWAEDAALNLEGQGGSDE